MSDITHDANADPSPVQLGLAIYALITTSVVLAGANGTDPVQITLLMVGQALALTVAHGYAESVAHRMTLWSGIVHSLPILIVAAPATLTGVVFSLLGFSGQELVYTAEALNLVSLVILQGLATRRTSFTWSRLASAVLLDSVAVVTVVLIVALLK